MLRIRIRISEKSRLSFALMQRLARKMSFLLLLTIIFPVATVNNSPRVIKLRRVLIPATITAYSSTRDQTDSTPFITASNTRVRHGVVAANFLPFGTNIKILEFGDQIFVVEDRMHPRFSNRVDVWFSNRKSALEFGKRESHIEVVGMKKDESLVSSYSRSDER